MKWCVLGVIILFLSACGFHLQGGMTLAPPLQRMYLQTTDPYSYFARTLKLYLKTSNVTLVDQPQQAHTILVILQNLHSQGAPSISGTQQTQQYSLTVTVTFEITDAKGDTIIAPQSLSESQTITVQSNQILGSTNEQSVFYQQLERAVVYDIMNNIASKNVTKAIMTYPGFAKGNTP